MSRVAGLIQFKVGGVQYSAKGAFTYNPGRPKRDAVIGADGVHGYKEVPQVAFIEGEVTDDGTLDLAGLVETKDTSVTLELSNGKVFILGPKAWFAGEGTVSTEESNIAVRFEAKNGEEIA
jgi:hypothetical protein